MNLYGLILGIAITIGIEYFSHHNITIPKSQESKFLLIGIILSVIGARTYHVLDSWPYYSQNFLQIFNLRGGGLGIYGALIFGLIYIYSYSKILKINFLGILDTLAPIIPLCQSVGRLGNFVNHEIPYWWLESILNLLLFLYLHFFPKHSFTKYLIGYGLIRFVFEFFRSDTWAIGHIKIAQIISIIFIAIGIYFLHAQTKTATKRPCY